MKYPNKITRECIDYHCTGVHEGRNRRGKYYAYIGYSSQNKKYKGYIRLPDGWQDMDRTWTSQDIYWVDKYDCICMQERVLLVA